ncbi:VIT1/CCC1 transporter family protein [Fodinisporobacter ferrooxydans]|uniref:VIT1/CCC1 transporter family protein n=1 Tax=Fodinisporobacter ferrooxydans TaxID=2901836 RepID=A0ABY4CPV4_9BACL|nr:VIT1/CCC1 transporter family protein [Alicyclobacillaceae bacterium MYW30-H2]
MSDGLTVPFALVAGLAGTVSTTTLLVTAGIAEIAAGSIAMGLRGFWLQEQIANTINRNILYSRRTDSFSTIYGAINRFNCPHCFRDSYSNCSLHIWFY